MRLVVPLVALTALAVSACQQPEPVNIRTGEGMVDPATGILDPRFVDGTFQLSAVIEEQIGGPLNNSDRREIDNALDVVLAAAPAAPPQGWRNPLRDTDGFVDLTSWRVDSRAGELCGIIRHESRFKEILAGAVTICRASIDPAWRVDEVVWAEPVAKAPATGRSKPRPPRPPQVVVVTPPPNNPPNNPPSNPPGNPPGTPPGNQPPVNYGPGAGGPQPPSTPPAAPVTGGGATTLGDALASPM